MVTAQNALPLTLHLSYPETRSESDDDHDALIDFKRLFSVNISLFFLSRLNDSEVTPKTTPGRDMSSNCTSAAPVSASKTKTKKKHFIGQKVKLFRASEPILSVLMWGVNHTVSNMS